MEFIYLDEICSTQKHAIDLVLSGKIQKNIIIIAKKQTSGVGRSGFKWQDGRGNLMASIILQIHENNIQSTSSLSMICGVILWKILYKIISGGSVVKRDIKMEIKWPNDLMLNGKKFAGIVVNHESFNGVSYSIIGIGINVRCTPHVDEYPVTSLLDEGFDVNLSDIIHGMAQEFNSISYKIPQDWFDIFEKNAFGLGRKIEIKDGENIKTGTLFGFNVSGQMVFLSQNGKKIIISSGKVRFVD